MSTVTNITISNFVETGNKTPLDRYTFDLEMEWVDGVGGEHTYAHSHTFPNDLAPMPLNARRYFAEQMIAAVSKVSIGAASWEDYK
ncbi:MAG TPA: hypothetical protein VLA24_09175 [Pseudomonadales bacterium]|nr:hypothetical protein [Pseudomonadales bacterium]